MIRSVRIADASAICEIYNHYVENTTITFEEEPITVTEMQNRIKTVTSTYPWLVLEKDGKVVGYAYANGWKNRSCYRYAAESSVYLSQETTGRGMGSQLYEALFTQLRTSSVHSVIGGIALPNPASVSLHEKLGFKKVAHFKEVGWKFNQWIDVGYWELLLEEIEKTTASHQD